MAAPTPSHEAIQSLILQSLDTSSTSTIPDSRQLTLQAEDGSSVSFTEGSLLSALKAVLDSLSSKEMITYTPITMSDYTLSPEGSSIATNGSHEAVFWAALPAEGEGEPKTIPELKKLLGDETTKIGQSRAFKNKWITKAGAGFIKATASIDDTTRSELLTISSTGTHEGGEKVLAELRKRKLILPRKVIHFSIAKGPEFALEVKKLETDLTTDMMTSGAWKSATFKKYNFAAAGAPTNGGALHPLLKVREEFRQIFFDMGFTEMPTNQFVESAFWNFDAMFVPQQHPAREMQDTFYVKDPVAALDPPADYYERVKTTHEVGGWGSIGYRAPFSKEETKKLLLRTHTTSVSTQMLYKLANQEGGFKPAKMFSIDRVFRNEATDATHLAEFHQVEGVVADYNISLGHLIGFMETFFNKAGNKKLRFKPAYNPYTEPSLEVFSFHEGLNKWIEVGNSGMFRPEMLEPMGLPKGVRVLGWGMSLERPTMIKYKLNDIRTLVGHKVDIAQVQSAAAVRLEKGE